MRRVYIRPEQTSKRNSKYLSKRRNICLLCQTTRVFSEVVKRSFNLRRLINEELTRLNAPISKKMKQKKRKKTVEEKKKKKSCFQFEYLCNLMTDFKKYFNFFANVLPEGLRITPCYPETKPQSPKSNLSFSLLFSLFKNCMCSEVWGVWKSCRNFFFVVEGVNCRSSLK